MPVLATVALVVRAVEAGAAFYRWVRGVEDERENGPSQPLPFSAVEHQRAQAAAAAHSAPLQVPASHAATIEPTERKPVGPEAQRGSS